MFDALHGRLCEQLLQALSPVSGVWRGRLSNSALSTAVAVLALRLADHEQDRTRIHAGLEWLRADQNEDGGWGDTDRSASNLAATLLTWSAFPNNTPAPPGVEAWLETRCGSTDSRDISLSVLEHYGGDRTFSAPILTACALAGRLGPEPDCWREVPQLPFELAVLPSRWFSRLGLPVVSYALPALIAIGLVRHRRSNGFKPWGLLRTGLTRTVLHRLRAIQPAHGGFLEAAPLTAFVAMSLLGCGFEDDPATEKALAFLRSSQRDDGGWPIDTDLATWLTSLSIVALEDDLPANHAGAARRWLLDQQYIRRHPYTNSPPGGWSWTDLPGAVPDADDTSAALIALRRLGIDDETQRAAQSGVGWLLGLQNRDGGMPTFCRGWGKLPFDRSCPDITAHAVQALAEWREDLSGAPTKTFQSGLAKALDYLAKTQREDGAWIPLWFGNEGDPNHENPLYGTARVHACLVDAQEAGTDMPTTLLDQSANWLRSAQNPDGGWGGDRNLPSTVEETALALAALADDPLATNALQHGADWLSAHVEIDSPAPIGFYFASLWYYEKLYPLIFATNATRRLKHHAGASRRVLP
ncbi:MAG: squalene--hopene cyclase [Lentisphaeria bacterium]|nr:squalene--hopene cyclase [Lentisphaeria bacterium]